MNNEYVLRGKVERSKIANDIKIGKLKRSDIELLAKEPQIIEAFIGDHYNNKIPKSSWDKEYLNLLSCVAVAESFNLDYLLYLNEVTEYVTKFKFKRMLNVGVAFILISILGVFLYFYISNGGRE